MEENGTLGKERQIEARDVCLLENTEDNKLNSPDDFKAILDALEDKLASEQINLESIITEKQDVNSSEKLSNAIVSIVWEQAINQIAVIAGEDFIKENNDLLLDLRAEAHIQTPENFDKGIIANHNREINYKERYDAYQNNFLLDENGKRIANNRGEWTLKPEPRKIYDKDRPKGSKIENIDHTIAAAEIIRDSEANTYYSQKELVGFANSEKNLNPLDAEANQSKKDLPMKEWLDSERNGQKPAERFNIDEEKLRQKDDEAREAYDKLKQTGKKKTIESGKRSQKQEAFKLTGKALRTAILTFLLELIRNLIRELVKWLRSKKRDIQSFLEHMKAAIHNFFDNIKKSLLVTGEAVLTTIVTSIIGPIVGLIKKAWLLIKQGGKTLLDAIRYVQDPENKDKPFQILFMEVGKIIIAGISAGGAIVLGEFIEKQLLPVPGFAFNIPMFGSLASIIGIFFGAIASGIIGAIAINTIDQVIAKKRMEILTEKQNTTTSVILGTQTVILEGRQVSLDRRVEKIQLEISNRHETIEQRLDETLLSTEMAEDLTEKRKMENEVRIQRLKELLEGQG